MLPPDLHDPYPFIKERQPDLVLLDVPYRQESEALTTLDKLKLDPATTAIPVLVCTTTPEALQGIIAREQDGDIALFAKPFDLDALLSALTTLLARRRPGHAAAGA
jgi:CheY-like chemotaxis protein